MIRYKLNSRDLRTTQDRLDSLKRHFEFLGVIVLFLPFIMNAIYGGGNAELDANRQLLTWGGTIAFLIVDYLFIELINEDLMDIFSKWINNLVLLNIATTVPLLIVVSQYGSTQIVGNAGYVFFFSLLLALNIPAVILILFLLDTLVKPILKSFFNSDKSTP